MESVGEGALGPDASPMRRTRSWKRPAIAVGAVLLVSGLLLIAVFSISSAVFPETEHSPNAAEVLRFAAFGRVDGLRIGSLSKNEFLDTVVTFDLRGSSADIDLALGAARFNTLLKPGVNVQAPSDLRTESRGVVGFRA